MTTRYRLNAEQAVKDFAERGKHHYVRAVLGNAAGVFDVPNRAGYIYARLLRSTGQQLIEARSNQAIQQIANLPVLLEKKERGYWLIGIDPEYADNPFAGTVGTHAAQHIIGSGGTGGFDGVPIYNAALINLHVRAQATPNMTVHVEEGWQQSGGITQHFAGADTSAFVVPTGASKIRLDLVCINSANAIQIVTGAEVTEPSTPAYPTIPDDVTVLAAIALRHADTVIVQSAIEELRVTAMPTGWGSVTTQLAPTIHAATAANPVDTDELGYWQNVANGLRKVTWLNAWANYFKAKADALYIAIGTVVGHVIQDEGTPLTQRANLNFVGGEVTVTDDVGNNATVVTIPTVTVPVKATGAELDGGTDDAKFATAKAILDSGLLSTAVNGEIAGLTAKTTPVSADVLLLEDSAASNAKKKLSWSNLLSNITVSGNAPVFLIDGVLAVATEVGSYVSPHASTITAVYIYCKATGTANDTIVDIHKNGVTIFATQGNRPTLNYADANKVAKSGTPDVTAVVENDVLTVDIDAIATGAANLQVIIDISTSGGGSGGSGHTIEDEGTPLTARTKLNFIGAGVTVTDNAGADSSDVTIPSGGTSDAVTNQPSNGNIAISGLAGSADIDGLGGGGITEEYDTTTTSLTWNSAPAAVDSNTTVKSHLYVKFTDTTERLGTRAWSPAGDFDIRTKIAGIAEASSPAAGLHVGNSDNSVRLLIQSVLAPQTPAIIAYTYSGGSYTQRGSTFAGFTSIWYFRITRVGSTVSFYFSLDGKLWALISSLTFSITVANTGYRTSSQSTVNAYVGSDWLRSDV